MSVLTYKKVVSVHCVSPVPFYGAFVSKSCADGAVQPRIGVPDELLRKIDKLAA